MSQDPPCDWHSMLHLDFRYFVVQIQRDANSAASNSSLTKCFVCPLERPIALRKAYVDLPTSPLAPTSMAKRWTPYPLASRSIVRSKYLSLFKALLRSILSSHGTVNSTSMKESVAVDANTNSGRLPLSCSTLWQCLSPCRTALTSQSLALKSKSILCFSFFSLRCCDEPSLKKYILLAGAGSMPSLPPRARSARLDCAAICSAHGQRRTYRRRARAGVTGNIRMVCSWRLGLSPTSASWFDLNEHCKLI